MLTFIHAADFHLDSAFGALDQRRAAARRRESRETVLRLANYVGCHGVDLVLLAGDLFDSAAAFRETGEQLSAALGQMEAQVFIAPGNHDWYGPGSPYRTVDWPENVHIFSENTLTAVELPEWNLVIHGAAFTAPDQPESLLRGFTAPADGKLHMGLLHGEVDGAEERYDPRSPAAALPIWPWATSTGGRSRCIWERRSAPGPAASRAGASTSWGRRGSTRGPWMRRAGCLWSSCPLPGGDMRF